MRFRDADPGHEPGKPGPAYRAALARAAEARAHDGRRWVRPAIILLTGLLVSACTGEAPAPAAADDLLGTVVHETFTSLRAAHDIPGIAVGVIDGDRTQVFEFGTTAPGGDRPVTEQTIFEIGSLSKLFTTLLAGSAASQERLDFDDTPGTYLPWLRDHPIDNARIRDIATYTAGGLPQQFPSEVTTEAEMWRYFQQWHPTYPVGNTRLYGNPGMALLGQATAASLGRPFEDAMRAEILEPLGLRHTYFDVPETAQDDYAWGTARSGAPVRVSPGPGDAEAYGLKTTAADLLSFVAANMDDRRAPLALRGALDATRRGYYRVGTMTQALGWERFEYPTSLEALQAGNSAEVINRPRPVEPAPAVSGPALFDKTGSTGGFGGYVAFVPSRSLAVVVLMNRSIPIPARIAAAHRVLDALDSV
ncbi:class C beta-lactamase [Nocardia grenadensis]|uniref:class C beta-lactamase n=1 Tax=Nocardia grenadensis TaxID=931537 RepID=UPI000A026214|nr:class C beta-lactamase [Nocardia grenadensis]